MILKFNCNGNYLNAFALNYKLIDYKLRFFGILIKIMKIIILILLSILFFLIY